MRGVEQSLVARVSVDRCHESLFDAELIMKDFDHRSQTVGGAGCVGDDMVRAVVVSVFVDTEYESCIRLCGRG